MSLHHDRWVAVWEGRLGGAVRGALGRWQGELPPSLQLGCCPSSLTPCASAWRPNSECMYCTAALVRTPCMHAKVASDQPPAPPMFALLFSGAAGTAATVRVLHAKVASDLATIPILNPTPHSQVRACVHAVLLGAGGERPSRWW